MKKQKKRKGLKRKAHNCMSEDKNDMIHQWREERQEKMKSCKPCLNSFRLHAFSLETLHSFAQNINFIVLIQMICAATAVCVFQYYDIWFDLHVTLFVSPIVFPLAFSINTDFQRREKVLEDLAQFKSSGMIWYFCMRDWRRAAQLDNEWSSIVHAKQRSVLFHIREFLLTHRPERRKIILRAIYEDFSDMNQLVEKLRASKLPSNTAIVSRSIHLLNMMCLSFERLRVIREYRSPRSIRSFNKVLIMILPIILSPYFVYVGKQSSNNWEPYVISVLVAFVFSALQGVQDKLDDPFDGMSEDDIHLDTIDEWNSSLEYVIKRRMTLGRRIKNGIGKYYTHFKTSVDEYVATRSPKNPRKDVGCKASNPIVTISNCSADYDILVDSCEEIEEDSNNRTESQCRVMTTTDDRVSSSNFRESDDKLNKSEKVNYVEVSVNSIVGNPLVNHHHLAAPDNIDNSFDGTVAYTGMNNAIVEHIATPNKNNNQESVDVNNNNTTNTVQDNHKEGEMENVSVSSESRNRTISKGVCACKHDNPDDKKQQSIDQELGVTDIHANYQTNPVAPPEINLAIQPDAERFMLRRYKESFKQTTHPYVTQHVNKGKYVDVDVQSKGQDSNYNHCGEVILSFNDVPIPINENNTSCSTRKEESQPVGYIESSMLRNKAIKLLKDAHQDATKSRSCSEIQIVIPADSDHNNVKLMKQRKFSSRLAGRGVCIRENGPRCNGSSSEHMGRPATWGLIDVNIKRKVYASNHV